MQYVLFSFVPLQCMVSGLTGQNGQSVTKQVVDLVLDRVCVESGHVIVLGPCFQVVHVRGHL